MTDQERETMRGREQMVRDVVREEFDRIRESSYPEDDLFEITDGCVPVYSSDLLDIAADCPDVALSEPELGPAFDGSPTPINIIAANIFERLLNVAHEEYQALLEEHEDEDEDQA